MRIPEYGAEESYTTYLEIHPSKPQESAMPTKKKSRSSGNKSGGRKYGKAAGKSVKSAMHREKRGTLRSGKGGKGGKVKNRKQAIAIGLSEARKKGAKVPPKKSSAKKKSSSRKKSS
jgi:hypothetical protein